MLEYFLNKVVGSHTLLKRDSNTSVLVFFCEFCEVSENSLFHRTPLVAASDL